MQSFGHRKPYKKVYWIHKDFAQLISYDFMPNKGSTKWVNEYASTEQRQQDTSWGKYPYF